MEIDVNHIHLFNALSKNLQKECQSMDEAIRNLAGIDLMLVGIGMNGHVGFNEPGISPDFYSDVINLADVTQKWDKNILLKQWC